MAERVAGRAPRSGSDSGEPDAGPRTRGASDALETPHVVVTGMGAISAVGRGCEALWAAMEAGRDGMAPIRRFSTSGFTSLMGAMVPGFEGPEHARFEDGTAEDGLWVCFAGAALEEAIAQAGLVAGVVPPHRIALVLGSLRGHRGGLHDLAEAVGALAGPGLIGGPRINVGVACSSSTHALGLGHDLLLMGAADVVLAGGADAITPDMYAGFHGLQLLSPEKCAPFSEPVGTTLGEGAGIVVLERAEHARGRGAAALGSLSGYGLSGDAYHATSPDPTGAGLVRAIVAALSDAGIDAGAVDYLNAHGTGTVANDAAEWQAMQRVFGARVPFSSSKSVFGHAQGAAGVLEAIVTLLAIGRQALPPTLHFTRPRARGPADPVAGDRPRAHRIDVALSTNAAFGGANGVLVLGQPRLAGRPRRRRRVLALGGGAVGPHGTTLDELLRALDDPPSARRVPAFAIDAIVPRADPRGLDATGRFLTAAAARALEDAGIAVRGAARDRAGLFVGSCLLSPESAREFEDSIEKRGYPRLSPNAFTRIVLNASTGACSKLLSLRGPNTTIAAGEASGLLAIVYAADFLSRHDEVDLIVAGGVEELPAPRAREDGSWGAAGRAAESVADESAVEVAAESAAEGAGFLVLAGAAALSGARPGPTVAGWSVAGPGREDDAVAAALAMAGLHVADVEIVAGDGRARAGGWREMLSPRVRHVDAARALGRIRSASAAIAMAAALGLMRRGAARTALVVESAARSCSCALVLSTGESHER